MTAKPKTARAVRGAKSLAFALGFLLLLFCTKAAAEGTRLALALCAEVVIPSLFPFMVVSELTVRSDAVQRFSERFAPIFHPLLGVSGAGGSALLLGLLCGFPIGAKSAATLYESGKISKNELRRLLCFCNQPSSAFVTGTVGLALFGSYRFGILLYGITLLSGLVIGIICRFLSFDGCSDAPLLHTSSNAEQTGTRFPDAVAGAAQSMLTVCAFVCFFSAAVACLEALPGMKQIAPPFAALLVGFFELTGGTARAAACPSPFLAATTAAWCLGWSGLSVHCQLMALCRRCRISFRAYFAAKAAQGLLNAMLVGLALRLCPAWMPATDPLKTVSIENHAWPLWLVLFVAAVVLSVLRWGKKRVLIAKIGQKPSQKHQK